LHLLSNISYSFVHADSNYSKSCPQGYKRLVGEPSMGK
jgi:hypothetical protein